MKLKKIKNLKWLNAEHTLIDADIEWEGVNEDEPWPCSLVRENDEPHITDTFNRAIAGEFGNIKEYTPPTDEELDIEDKAAEQYEIDANKPDLDVLIEALDSLVKGKKVPLEIKNKLNNYKTKRDTIRNKYIEIKKNRHQHRDDD